MKLGVPSGDRLAKEIVNILLCDTICVKKGSFSVVLLIFSKMYQILDNGNYACHYCNLLIFWQKEVAILINWARTAGFFLHCFGHLDNFLKTR